VADSAIAAIRVEILLLGVTGVSLPYKAPWLSAS
jgi:hypothetical protein